jgi:hypothetical protein
MQKSLKKKKKKQAGSVLPGTQEAEAEDHLNLGIQFLPHLHSKTQLPRKK